MTRTYKLAATAVLGLALAGTVAACGDETEAPSAASSTVAEVTPPSDRSVPVVPGRKPTSETTQTPKSSTPDGVKSCGATAGPDGALQIHLVGGDVTCATAKAIAKDYSPLIATGKAQKIKEWDCGPSNVAGELARCTKDDLAFALVP
ncbi:hypothetical protein nbrc107696_07390 [Gordonia spumicola]|uniref:Lipoprotein n=2 Tax=Gordonia spumicola TaxID=589161 RepID=A0A7I9V524_9ACTN|nr:hypothetical protein nbrc107696_07390 [Gordonia spumicola]